MYATGQALGLVHQRGQEGLQAVCLGRQLANVAQVCHYVTQCALNPERQRAKLSVKSGMPPFKRPRAAGALHPVRTRRHPPKCTTHSRVECKCGLRDVTIPDLAGKVTLAQQQRGQEDCCVLVHILPERQVCLPAHLSSTGVQANAGWLTARRRVASGCSFSCSNRSCWHAWAQVEPCPKSLPCQIWCAQCAPGGRPPAPTPAGRLSRKRWTRHSRARAPAGGVGGGGFRSAGQGLSPQDSSLVLRALAHPLSVKPHPLTNRTSAKRKSASRCSTAYVRRMSRRPKPAAVM